MYERRRERGAVFPHKTYDSFCPLFFEKEQKRMWFTCSGQRLRPLFFLFSQKIHIQQLFHWPYLARRERKKLFPSDHNELRPNGVSNKFSCFRFSEFSNSRTFCGFCAKTKNIYKHWIQNENILFNLKKEFSVISMATWNVFFRSLSPPRKTSLNEHKIRFLFLQQNSSKKRSRWTFQVNKSETELHFEVKRWRQQEQPDTQTNCW